MLIITYKISNCNLSAFYYYVLLLAIKGGRSMIELKNINISFGKKECIKNGHFKAYPYQITSIIGESGTGKSSLLYLVAMLTSKSCKYYYNGKLLELNEKDKIILEIKKYHLLVKIVF